MDGVQRSRTTTCGTEPCFRVLGEPAGSAGLRRQQRDYVYWGARRGGRKERSTNRALSTARCPDHTISPSTNHRPTTAGFWVTFTDICSEAIRTPPASVEPYRPVLHRLQRTRPGGATPYEPSWRGRVGLLDTVCSQVPVNCGALDRSHPSAATPGLHNVHQILPPTGSPSRRGRRRPAPHETRSFGEPIQMTSSSFPPSTKRNAWTATASPARQTKRLDYMHARFAQASGNSVGRSSPTLNIANPGWNRYVYVQ